MHQHITLITSFVSTKTYHYHYRGSWDCLSLSLSLSQLKLTVTITVHGRARCPSRGWYVVCKDHTTGRQGLNFYYYFINPNPTVYSIIDSHHVCMYHVSCKLMLNVIRYTAVFFNRTAIRQNQVTNILYIYITSTTTNIYYYWPICMYVRCAFLERG